MAALPSGTLLAAMTLGREDNLGLAFLCLLLTKTRVTSIHGSLATPNTAGCENAILVGSEGEGNRYGTSSNVCPNLEIWSLSS